MNVYIVLKKIYLMKKEVKHKGVGVIINMKIQILGLGMVGSSIAFELIRSRIPSMLSLFDIEKEKCVGDHMDLERAMILTKYNCLLLCAPEAIHSNIDVNIICIGQRCNYKEFNTKDEAIRDLYYKNFDIVSDTIKNLTGKIIIVTNPADIIADKLRFIYPKKDIIHAGDKIDKISDGAVITTSKGCTNWGIAVEVRQMIEEIIENEKK